MKRTIYAIVSLFVASSWLVVGTARLAYSETPMVPVEEDANVYLARIVDVPSETDSRWDLVPKEEMATQLQFLVDQQNSNYERIRTWSGSYYQIRKDDLGWLAGQNISNLSATPSKVFYEDLFTFACDVRKDKSYMRLERLYEQYYDKSGREMENPKEIGVDCNICSILTKDQYIRYDFDLDQMRGELEGVMPERLGKVCVSMSADDQRDVSRVGTLFDPRLFFYSAFKKTFEAKTWHNIEQGFVRWLRGELNDEMRQRALDRLTLHRGEFDSVVWYRVVYREENGKIRDEYVFNSEANFNMVLSRECDDGVPFMTVAANYRSENDIYVPEQCLFISDKGESFRYFKHIESSLNEKIPSDQFDLKALGLEDGTVVLDETKETSYEYVNGSLKPIAKFGATESYARDSSFWRSPARIIAFVAGVALIAFGVVRRFKKRSAQA